MVTVVSCAEACDTAKAFVHLDRNENRASKLWDSVGTGEVIASVVVVGLVFVFVSTWYYP